MGGRYFVTVGLFAILRRAERFFWRPRRQDKRFTEHIQSVSFIYNTPVATHFSQALVFASAHPLSGFPGRQVQQCGRRHPHLHAGRTQQAGQLKQPIRDNSSGIDIYHQGHVPTPSHTNLHPFKFLLFYDQKHTKS